MIKMTISSGHVEQNLEHQGFSHIDVGSILHFLTIAEFDISVSVNDKEFFVFGSHLIELFIFFEDIFFNFNLFFWVFQVNMNFRSVVDRKIFAWLDWLLRRNPGKWFFSGRIFFKMFKPFKERKGPFIVVKSFCVFSFVEILVSFFSELFIWQKPGAAFDASDFFVILTVEKQRMLKINWVCAEYFSWSGDWLRGFLTSQKREVNLVCWQVVVELGHERLIKAWIRLEKVRVSLLFRASHEWTSASWNLFLIRRRVDLLVLVFLWFSLGFSFVWTFWFVSLDRLLGSLALFLCFVFHEGTLGDVVRRAEFRVIKSRFDFWVGALGLFFREKVL